MSKKTLKRIAEALERLSPAAGKAPDFAKASAFVWHADPDRLEPVAQVNRIGVDLLVGVDRSRDTLMANTLQFAAGMPANNALLWGARGMGKSSLVKAIHGDIQATRQDLKIVEVQREDLPSIDIDGARLKDGLGLLEGFVLAGLATTNSEARRLVQGGGARLNDAPQKDINVSLSEADIVNGSIKLSAGKKRHAIAQLS